MDLSFYPLLVRQVSTSWSKRRRTYNSIINQADVESNDEGADDTCPTQSHHLLSSGYMEEDSVSFWRRLRQSFASPLDRRFS